MRDRVVASLVRRRSYDTRLFVSLCVRKARFRDLKSIMQREYGAHGVYIKPRAAGAGVYTRAGRARASAGAGAGCWVRLGCEGVAAGGEALDGAKVTRAVRVRRSHLAFDCSLGLSHRGALLVPRTSGELAV